MKKHLIIGLSWLILVMSITACGKAAEGHTSTSAISVSKNEATNSTKTNDVLTDDNNTATSSSFEEGVFIDVDQIDSPNVDDNLKEELLTMLEAVVKHDTNYFKNIFPEAYASDFEALLTGPYRFRFYEVSTDAYIDAEERVSIDVLAQMEEGQNIKDFSWLLYFKKDNQGTWKLIAID